MLESTEDFYRVQGEHYSLPAQADEFVSSVSDWAGLATWAEIRVIDGRIKIVLDLPE